VLTFVDPAIKPLKVLTATIEGEWSFRVTLGSEPSDLSVAIHPIVNVSFANQAVDNPQFGA